MFYVGCTRAIDRLYFSFINNPKEVKKVLNLFSSFITFCWFDFKKVCRFFAEIKPEYYEKDIEITKEHISRPPCNFKDTINV